MKLSVHVTFKFANVTPVLKQGTRNLKDNDRSISILAITAKILLPILPKKFYESHKNG